MEETLTNRRPDVSLKEWGEAMYGLIERLYPIPRSLTGDGVRATLRILEEKIPLQVHEVPSGTEVFDWRIPREWNIRDAYVQDGRGEKIVDFRKSSLHVVGYSRPVRASLSLSELRRHLFTLSEHPDWVPYRTSYYEEDWGFCVSDRLLQEMSEDRYEVLIDSSLEDGHLTYGELLIPGESQEEILLHTHVCHPALCNDNLSGISVSWALARILASRRPRLSYRFLFLPGTIGAVTWLARNEASTSRIRGGLVLACLGDEGHSTYKRSRRGRTWIDRAVEHVLDQGGKPFRIEEFSPWGYDERQYCSPGFDLPVGVLMRTPHGRFPEYHTSADNLDFVKPWALADSLQVCLRVVEILEHDRTYRNRNPQCEPQLGKRGLYRRTEDPTGPDKPALLWVLNLSDGSHSLLEIARRARLPFGDVLKAARVLADHGLLEAGDWN